MIAPFVIDAELQELPQRQGASGVKNLSYLDSFKSIDRDIKAFKEIVPFRHLAVLVDGTLLEAIPRVRERASEVMRAHAIEISVISAETSAEAALAALPPETDAVFVAPLVRFTPAEFQKLVTGLINRRLPSFSFWGREEVERGLLSSVAPESDYPRLARRVALNVQRILLGEDAGTFKVAFPAGERLVINMATAREIGVYPPWSVLIEAELLHREEEDIEQLLTLESTIRRAVDVNLDLAVADRDVAAGVQRVREALAELLPQVDISNEGTFIDDDQAEASKGLQAERTLTGSVTARQLIYSDDTWANFRIEQYRQVSREEDRAALRLDIARAAVIAYLEGSSASSWVKTQMRSSKRSSSPRACSQIS